MIDLREELRRLADELDACGRQRDEIGEDASSDCEHGDDVDCHTVAAVSTWFRAAAMLRKRADELPAPKVYLADDQVPVGAVITGKDGSPFRVPDVYASEGLARVGMPFVEVPVPSPEEWQAAVDRARAEREEASRG